MEKDFIRYEQAIAMKELGFDEPCIAFYIENDSHSLQYFKSVIKFNTDGITNEETNTSRIGSLNIVAPLYQQAFRWFREKYKLESSISAFVENFKVNCYLFEIIDVINDTCYEGIDNGFSTHEEAELACLKKLIEIVKK